MMDGVRMFLEQRKLHRLILYTIIADVVLGYMVKNVEFLKGPLWLALLYLGNIVVILAVYRFWLLPVFKCDDSGFTVYGISPFTKDVCAWEMLEYVCFKEMEERKGRMRESGVVERLTKAAQNEIANVTTIFLGLAIGGTMTGETFIQVDTLLILGMGLLAFVLDTVGGVLFGKLMYVLSGRKFNPLIGAAGISAFPMSARIVHRLAQEYDFENFLLMHAMGANTAGQLGSVVAGGVVLALLVGMP